MRLDPIRGLVLALAVLMAAPVWAGSAKKKPVKVGYIEFPPVFWTAPDKTPKGYLIDLARMTLERSGYAWTAVSRPTRRMAVELVDGRIDLWIGLPTLPEFRGTTLIGPSTVATIELNAYWMESTPPINGWQDLLGKSAVVVHGFSYGGKILNLKDPANGTRVCEAYSHEQGLAMLKAGRCEYFLDYTGPMREVLRKHPIPELRKHRLQALDAHFVVTRKRPDARQLLDDLENAYAELVAEGAWPP
ncbi:MAG: hypothetical protein D6758_14075 [Gammaproteobacteria bacterium]|nr:MAG: hypothetical protein D6758_14075 [Gammaproteobacteria bacterium]